MQLSIIVLSYNTAQLTIQTLKSVIAELEKNSSLLKKTEVIVVDNHSTDSSVIDIQRLVTRYPKLIQLLPQPDNRGFAYGNNRGIEQSRGEVVLLLNSDTTLKPGSLQKLLATFESHPFIETEASLQRAAGNLDRLGIVAAELVNTDGTLQPQGGSFPNLLSLASHWMMIDDIPVIGRLFPSTQHTGRNFRLKQNQQSQELLVKDWVGATAMAIRREVFNEIGLLDEGIFMYGEDVEFCMRAQNHHFDVAIQPAAQVIHIGSASSSSANSIKGEALGYVYIWSKHKPDWQLPIARFVIKLGAFLRWIVFGTMIKDATRRQVYRQLLKQI